MTQMDQDDPHTPPKQKQQTFTSGDDDKDDVNYLLLVHLYVMIKQVKLQVIKVNWVYVKMIVHQSKSGMLK